MDIEHKEVNKNKALHIAMFPWLAYGHLMPFLQVSEFLAQKGHRVTFISTPKNIRRLPTSPSPLIKYVELPMPAVDGLPQTAESTSDLPINKVPFLKKAYDKLELPLTHVLQHLDEVNWIVHDFACHWLPRVATRLRVNSAFFSIYNSTTMAFLGSPSVLLNDKRQRPEDFTVVPDWIDYPSDVTFKLYEVVSHWECMDDDVSDFHRFGEVINGCDMVAVRTRPEFDADSLNLIQKLYGKPVVPLGLLPPILQNVEAADELGDDEWRLLREWLDDKEEESVVYIALGTEVTLSRESLHELALGVEKSGLPFIWVLGSRQLVDDGPDIFPPGFVTRVVGRGMIWRGWAPQLRILAHSSIGGFLTHCGWSSVIEALGFGRVLILFPGDSSDQGLIARLMQSKHVGLEVARNDRDGLFNSDAVVESMRRAMVDKEGEALRSNARAMKEIFGNVSLNNKYLDEFTRILDSWNEL